MSYTPNKKLAEALRGLELTELAVLAAKGHYGDLTSPLATPKIALADALFTAAEMVKDIDKRQAILVLRKRVMGGDFDG